MKTFLVIALTTLVACAGKPSPPPPVSNAAPPATTPHVPAPEGRIVVEQVSGLTTIRGTLRSALTEEPLGGATIVITSSVLMGELVEMSNESGEFTFGELPPGEYTVAIYYNDTTRKHTVAVEAGNTARVTITWVDDPI